MKKCNTCSLNKDQNKFYKSNGTKDGLYPQCKDCRKIYDIKNKDKQYARVLKDREKRADHWKQYFKEYNLKRNYGITLVDYRDLQEKQDNKCAICQFPETKKHRNGKTCELAVDHCHKTGQVRGLLCFKCNSAIGKFSDDKQILQNAIDYLLKCDIIVSIDDQT